MLVLSTAATCTSTVGAGSVSALLEQLSQSELSTSRRHERGMHVRLLRWSARVRPHAIPPPVAVVHFFLTLLSSAMLKASRQRLQIGQCDAVSNLSVVVGVTRLN